MSFNNNIRGQMEVMMNFIKRNFIKIIFLIILILVLFVVGLKYYLNKNRKVDVIEEGVIEVKKKEVKKDEVKNKIYIDIKGAVKNPGVYELDENSKVIDLVKLSGGLTDEADTTYVNLAKKLSDEMVVIIYTKNQIKEAKQKEKLAVLDVNNTCICPKISNDACITKESTQEAKKSTKSITDSKTSTGSGESIDKKVNINTATMEELQTLTGVGASKALAIIQYREENGKFVNIDDIMKVNGIGESLYEKIKDYITI